MLYDNVVSLLVKIDKLVGFLSSAESLFHTMDISTQIDLYPSFVSFGLITVSSSTYPADLLVLVNYFYFHVFVKYDPGELRS